MDRASGGSDFTLSAGGHVLRVDPEARREYTPHLELAGERDVRTLLAITVGFSVNGAAQAQGLIDRFGHEFPRRAEGWGNAPIPDDGVFHVDGDWLSVYCKNVSPTGLIAQSNVRWADPSSAESTIALTVHGGKCDAAEIASDAGWTFNGGKSFPYGKTGLGYGYYEAEMKTAYGDGSDRHGVVNAFFVRGAVGKTDGLQNPEIDFEFLTNEDWNAPGTGRGRVHLSATGISGDAISKAWPLPFNPSAGFHRYGFLWRPGHVSFFTDGALVTDYTLADLTLPPAGVIIIANSWTGTQDWGGLPPLQDKVSFYKYIKYLPDERTN